MNKKVFKLIFEGIVVLIAMIMMFVNHWIYIPNHYISSIIMFVLATILVFYLEINNFKYYKQILTFDFTMDFLITIAIHITYLYSLIMSIVTISNQSIHHLKMEFWEVSYSLSFFIGIGHLIEDKLKLKTSIGIKDLLKLQNKSVQVEVNGEFKDIKSNQIKVGDIVKINKGASIPTDGILLTEFAFLDYSSLLGESIPKKVLKNQQVLSGSINIDNFIIYKATKSAKDSTLLKIVAQLENIMNQKSNVERTSEKVIKYFLPSILFIALATLITWLIIGYLKIDVPKVFISNYNNVWTNAIYHSVATLVIACPCAFGIAAPAAIYSSSGIAAKNKILFSSAKIYEMVNHVKYIAFDKTGTLTMGKPNVINYDTIDAKYENIILNIASHSTHPISNAIKNFFNNKIEVNKKIKFDELKEISGIGMVAKNDDKNYFLGSIKYALDHNFKTNSKLNNKNINTVFAINKEIIATFEIDDLIKEDAINVIKKFKDIDIKTIILSGDNEKRVKEVANKLNIDYAYGELLPDQKATKVQDYKSSGDIIFVGDGVNDVLAIKSATIGIAYASGSEITNSIADISLLEPNLNLVYKTIVLAKRTLKLVRFNFIWAILFNFLCIPLAILGLIPPLLGAILMICSTTLLLANTLFFQNRNKLMLKKL